MSRGLINQNQLNMALKEQKEKGRMLGEMLVELGYVTQEKINDILCEMLNIEFIDLQVEEPEENVRDLIPEEVMRKYTLVPMRYDKNNAGVIQVAMADPMNILAMDDINIITDEDQYIINGVYYIVDDTKYIYNEELKEYELSVSYSSGSTLFLESMSIDPATIDIFVAETTWLP